MKAKDLLKALCKSGILEGDIYPGGKIEDGTLRILEGDIVSTNDYFFSSTRIGFEHYDAKIEAKSGTVFFLYSVLQQDYYNIPRIMKKHGYALNRLDGSDQGVRLDYYDWKIDYWYWE